MHRIATIVVTSTSLALSIVSPPLCGCFTPTIKLRPPPGAATKLGMIPEVTGALGDAIQCDTSMHAGLLDAASSSAFSSASSLASASSLVAFSDQGQNLAGIFFQASLLPYLIFLYFLSYPKNNTPALGNFGFQYLLLFVLSTIPSGIVSKLSYGTTLANVDWLHGGAESLLTVTSLLVVCGFRDASVRGGLPAIRDNQGAVRAASLGLGALFLALCAAGPSIGLTGSSEFLSGIGYVPPETFSEYLPSMRPEPANALSIPTWAIHFSSVFEWIFAMNVLWRYAEVTGNEKWKVRG